MTAAETWDNGDSDSVDTEEMLENKDVRGRDVGWWRRRWKKAAGQINIDKDGGSRYARCQGRQIRIAENTTAETRGNRYSSKRDVTERRDGGDNKRYVR